MFWEFLAVGLALLYVGGFTNLLASRAKQERPVEQESRATMTREERWEHDRQVRAWYRTRYAPITWRIGLVLTVVGGFGLIIKWLM